MGIKIMEGLSNIIGAYTQSKPMTRVRKNYIKDVETAIGIGAVTSVVVKDGIGCVMYVTQSLNNKKIQEEKRKFVAALDLTNGILMIAAQIALFFAVREYSGKIFDKLFKGSFNPAAQSNAISRLRMRANQLGETVYKKLVGAKNYNEFKESASSVFKFCLELGAATIIGKRIIVPLIATPLANKVKNWMNKDDLKKEAAKEAPAKPETKQIAAPAPEAHKLDTGSTNLLDKYRQK